MTCRPSVTFSWMDFYCEFYGGRPRLEMWPLHSVIVVYTDAFEPPITEG